MTEGDRFHNNLWSKLVEHGDYTCSDLAVDDCSQCGRKHVECQILTSDSDSTKPPVPICLTCGGIQE